jgi:hypothetical protein
MCDYSAEDVKSRSFQQGEVLTLETISRHGTRGFVSPTDPLTAVCIHEDGTKLQIVNSPPGFQRRFGLTMPAVATFFRLPLVASRGGWRDSIRFESGREVLLVDIPERITVICEPVMAERGTDDHGLDGIQFGKIIDRGDEVVRVGGGVEGRVKELVGA